MAEHKQPQIKKTQPKFIKVADIKPGVHGYNVYVKVTQLKVEEVTRNDGSKMKIVECTFGDDTAVVTARILGEPANVLKENEVFAIRNGRSQVFKERQRLEVDRWGKITAEPGHKIEKVNTGKNLSDTLYEAKIVNKK